MSSNVVLRQVLPLNAIRLGRLVVSVEHPHQDFLDPICDQEPGFLVSDQTDYGAIQDSSADNSFSSTLARLVSASRSKHQKSTTHFEADQTRTYLMTNSGLWFENAVQLEQTRKWIEKVFSEGNDIYLVVGYFTMTNARVIESDAIAREASLRLEDPMSTVLTAATSTNEITSPAVSGHISNTQLARQRFLTPGEKIYAVQYRKFHFKWFSSRNLAHGGLEKKNRWEAYWRVRALQADEDDVMEVTLVEDLDLGDGYEKHAFEAEGDFYI